MIVQKGQSFEIKNILLYLYYITHYAKNSIIEILYLSCCSFVVFYDVIMIICC